MMNDTPSSKSMPTYVAVSLALFFAVIFVMNGVLVYMAKTSWNGVVTKDPYQKGVVFNQVLAAQQAQDALGWRAMLQHASGNLLTLTLQDSQQSPIQHALVEGLFYRPVAEGVDLPFTMKEEKPGTYTVSLAPPLPGWWDVRLLVTASGSEFRYVQRLQFNPTSQNGG